MTQRHQVKAFICLLCLVISAFAFNEHQNEDDSREISAEKRAFVKCIGNPVGCYGKRAAMFQKIDHNSNSNSKYPRASFDWILETIKVYHQNCKSGDVKSCKELSRLLSVF